jgi:hypothetical protein
LIFEGVFTHPNNVYAEAATLLEEFKRCTKIEMQPTQTDEVERDTCMTGWLPPPKGVIKVNWDASLNKKEGCIGLGIIARDSVGNFLGARCLTQKIMTDPHTAEALATSCAVSFSKDVGFFNVVFEGDA